MQEIIVWSTNIGAGKDFGEKKMPPLHLLQALQVVPEGLTLTVSPSGHPLPLAKIWWYWGAKIRFSRWRKIPMRKITSPQTFRTRISQEGLGINSLIGLRHLSSGTFGRCCVAR